MSAVPSTIIGSCVGNARPIASIKAPSCTRLRRHVARSGSNGAMGSAPLLELLQNVANGLLTADDAVVQLEGLVTPLPPGSDDEGPPPAETAASLAKADFPEVVWGEGKSASHLVTSLQGIADRQGVAAATRVPPEVAAEVAAELPAATYNEAAATLVLKSTTKSQQKLPGTIAIIAAGTANARVVEECRVMLSSMGCYSFKLPESGVMGMHRIVQNIEAIRAADVVLCVTGADGGIVSIVAGMVECPVVALPTSVGYGTAFGGVAPLLGALNSSAPGVTVVNIDSGFGAAMAAWRSLKAAAKIRAAVLQAASR